MAITAKTQALKEELALLQKARKRIAAARREALPERQLVAGRGSVATAKSRILGQNQAPAARAGEDTMGSRGYMFHKAAGLANGAIRPEDAQLEFNMSDRLKKSFRDHKGGWREATERDGINTNKETIVSPLGMNFLYSEDSRLSCIDKELAFEVKSLLDTQPAYDPEYASWMVQKGLVNPALVTKTNQQWNDQGFTQKVGGSTQSFLQENLGGALVPFPEFGPLVPLLRNNSAVLASGAVIFPLPPSGRITFPRQTTPTTAYNVGEGANTTQSSVGTGQIEIAGKKIGAYIVTNNELLRFGGPIVEQLFRNDMMISISLLFDQNLMVGAGSENVTQGLVGYSGVQSFNGTGSATTTNGYTLAPGDPYTMIGNVEAANAKFEGWLIYPTLLRSMQAKRAGVAAVGDSGGLFLFDLTRGFEDGKQIDYLAGFKVVNSSNVPNGRVKSSGTNLTVLFGGMWSNMRIGMFGSIEFAMANQGAIFQADQTAVRAIMTADGAPLNPGAFIYADQLLPTTIGN
jgi:HK97 family phage major capsid protein